MSATYSEVVQPQKKKFICAYMPLFLATQNIYTVSIAHFLYKYRYHTTYLPTYWSREWVHMTKCGKNINNFESRWRISKVFCRLGYVRMKLGWRLDLAFLLWWVICFFPSRSILRLKLFLTCGKTHLWRKSKHNLPFKVYKSYVSARFGNKYTKM